MDVHDRSTQALFALLREGTSCVEHALAASVRCQIGPVSCTVSSNSPALCARLTRCLIPGGVGDWLTIGVLSGSEPPFALPPSWNLPHTDRRHLERLHLSPDGTLSSLYNPDHKQWTILDHINRRALLWIEDESLLSFWEEAAPFKAILNWFLGPSHLVLVHGGVVGDGHAGCLLVGPGGSGKSTTVAACFERGLNVCGDDLALVEDSPSGWDAWALYNAIKLDPTGRIPIGGRLAEAPSTPCGGKRLVRYSDASRAQLVPRLRLAAIVQCVITNRGQSAIKPASPAAVLKALAPSTVFILRGREQKALAKISKLVRTLPCFRLELGTNPAEIADFLADWLSAALIGGSAVAARRNIGT
jgi:hypothetical protein